MFVLLICRRINWNNMWNLLNKHINIILFYSYHIPLNMAHIISTVQIKKLLLSESDSNYLKYIPIEILDNFVFKKQSILTYRMTIVSRGTANSSKKSQTAYTIDDTGLSNARGLHFPSAKVVPSRAQMMATNGPVAQIKAIAFRRLACLAWRLCATGCNICVWKFKWNKTRK